MLKTTVSSARNGSFSFKKRRFLKLIRIFVGIKSFYLTDSQRLACNAKNKRFFCIELQCAGKYRLYARSEQPFC